MRCGRNSTNILLILMCFLIINIIIVRCKKSTDPNSTNTDPDPITNNLTTYIPLQIGNSWTYIVQSLYSYVWGQEYRTMGIEVWKIESISEDSLKFGLECEFNGIRRKYDRGILLDSTIYENQTTLFDIILLAGPDSVRASLSIVLEGWVTGDTNFTVLGRFLNRKFFSDYRCLEVSFSRESDSLLNISHGPIYTDSYYHKIDYQIQRNLGIIDINLGMQSDNVANYSYELISCQLN